MYTNSFGHDDNEGENFYVEKHCETLSWVSINSKERQSQNKNRALNFTGPKDISRRNGRNAKKQEVQKTNQKVASNELTGGWNQL